MTPEEFKLIRIGLGYESPGRLGKVLGVSHTAVHSKENGHNPVKGPLAMLMCFMMFSDKETIEQYSENMIAAEEFEAIRKGYGIAREDFADSIGLSWRAAYKYEKGFEIPNHISMLMQFMEAATPTQLEKVGWMS